MKKVKKLLTLTVATLLMGGLVVSAPQNTRTASAGVVHTKEFDENAKILPVFKIEGSYKQLITLRTRHQKTGQKSDVKLMLETSNGDIKMRIFEYPKDGHVFDDEYAFIGLVGWGGPRLKWTTNFNPRGTITSELQELVLNFNMQTYGKYNTFKMVGKDSLDSVKYSTSSGTSAFIGPLKYDYSKGFSSEENKYNYLFKFDASGIKEMALISIGKNLFKYSNVIR